MSTPEPGHVSPAVTEYRIQLLELELSQEKRDHDETRRQLSLANKSVGDFERLTARLSAHIDQQDVSFAKATKLLNDAVLLLDRVTGAHAEILEADHE
jgi:hypothetical protein